MKKSQFKILFVDDETELLEVWKEYVEILGYEGLVAAGAEEGLKLLEEHHSRVIMIFSDFKMPGLNGFQFREMTLEKYKSIPFCIVSGFITKEMALDGIDQKISGFISKPMDDNEIADYIEKHCSDRIQEIEFEEELREVYLEESCELIQEVEQLLLSLEQEPGNLDHVNGIYRLVHTIKGGCNVLDNAAIASFLHHYEDIYSSIRSGALKVESKVINVLLTGYDRIVEIYGAIVADRPVDYTESELLSLISLDDAEGHIKISQGPSPGAVKSNSKSVAKKKEVLNVPMAMLDEFMAQSGEITVIRNMVNKLVAKISKELPTSKSVQHLEELLEEMHKINALMQTKLTEIRKVPLSAVFRPVPRAIRDLCESTGKQVRLEMEGETLRVDTLISQVLNNSVIHMVRNSVDHGIERPEDREAKGKPSEGLLRIDSQESGENIIVKIMDDGQGINSAKIRKKIVEKNFLSEEEAAALAEDQVYQYLFESGFSTAEQITDVSGRGVGMDMVRASIESLGGKIEVSSEPDKGSTFKLVMPIPKSVQIINALIVSVDSYELSIPQDKVVRLLIVDSEKKNESLWNAEGSELLAVDGGLISIVNAREVLGLDELENSRQSERHFVIVRTDEDLQFAIEVDGILDNESIVVKDLESFISQKGLFHGATFLGNGFVGLILDIDGIAANCGIKVHSLQERSSIQETDMTSIEHLDFEDYISIRLNAPGLFAMRLSNIFRFERLPTSGLQLSGGLAVYSYRKKIMPILDLTEVLHFKQNQNDVQADFISVVVVEREGQLYGLKINSLEDVYRIEDKITNLVVQRDGLEGNLIIAGKNHAVVDVQKAISLHLSSSVLRRKTA